MIGRSGPGALPTVGRAGGGVGGATQHPASHGRAFTLQRGSTMSYALPTTARIAVQSAPLAITTAEVPVPALAPDQALVRVDGCGICGTDVAQYTRDPFGLLPAHLGHEGTGTIVALGPLLTHDWTGQPLAVGDQVVTGPSFCGTCHACVATPESPELCEASRIHGLIGAEEGFLQGWFGEYVVIGGRDAIFRVTGLSLEHRLLVEPAAVVSHALQRAKRITDISHRTTVVVQGAGPIGLVLTALLCTTGVSQIVVVDPVADRLDLARRLGAAHVVEAGDAEATREAIAAITGGLGADLVFQCTGSPSAASAAWAFARRGGAIVEVGSFADAGEGTYNPHRDVCHKQVTLTGSWTYSAHDWALAVAFLRESMVRELPLADLITHRYDIDSLESAMQTCVDRTGVKVVIQPGIDRV